MSVTSLQGCVVCSSSCQKYIDKMGLEPCSDWHLNYRGPTLCGTRRSTRLRCGRSSLRRRTAAVKHPHITCAGRASRGVGEAACEQHSESCPLALVRLSRRPIQLITVSHRSPAPNPYSRRTLTSRCSMPHSCVPNTTTTISFLLSANDLPIITSTTTFAFSPVSNFTYQDPLHTRCSSRRLECAMLLESPYSWSPHLHLSIPSYPGSHGATEPCYQSRYPYPRALGCTL